jgi:metal-responsive CopG/Arc/MetJ family transcriptional regulator
MARQTAVVGFSVPPDLAEEVEAMARAQRVSKSELFRRMVEAYRERLEEEELRRLQGRMSAPTATQRVFTEEEVDALCFEDR